MQLDFRGSFAKYDVMTEINVDPLLLSKPDQLNSVLVQQIRKDILPLISSNKKKDIKDKA